MHSFILFSFVTLVIGAVALTSAAGGARRVGDSYRTAYLAFLSAFTFSVLLYLFLTYVRVNVGEPSALFLAVWGGLDGTADLAVLVTAVLFFHALFEVRYARIVARPLIAVSIVIAIAFVLSGGPAVASQADGVPPLVAVALVYYYLLFAYLVGLSLVKVWSLTGWRRRFFGYGLSAFLLVGAVESVLTLPHFRGQSHRAGCIASILRVRRSLVRARVSFQTRP